MDLFVDFVVVIGIITLNTILILFAIDGSKNEIIAAIRAASPEKNK